MVGYVYYSITNASSFFFLSDFHQFLRVLLHTIFEIRNNVKTKRIIPTDMKIGSLTNPSSKQENISPVFLTYVQLRVTSVVFGEEVSVVDGEIEELGNTE